MELEKLPRENLLQACRDGREEAAQLALRAGASPTARSRGKSCIQLAGESGNAEVLNLLFRNGADPNERDSSGQPVLLWAIENGNYGLAQELLNNKADPFAKDMAGSTALHAACKSNLDFMVELLIKLNCPVGAVDNRGNTPLHVAALFDACGPATRIISAGADVNITNMRGLTPLSYARYARRHSMADLLESHGGVEYPNFKQLLFQFDQRDEPLQRDAEHRSSSQSR